MKGIHSGDTDESAKAIRLAKMRTASWTRISAFGNGPIGK